MIDGSRQRRKTTPKGVASRWLMFVGGMWIGLCATLFLVLLGASLFNLIAGKPEGEAIVMAPVALVFLSACALPGACLMAFGWLLTRADTTPTDL